MKDSPFFLIQQGDSKAPAVDERNTTILYKTGNRNCNIIHDRFFGGGLRSLHVITRKIVHRTSLQFASRFSSFSAFASPSCASSLRAHRAAKVNRQSPLPGCCASFSVGPWPISKELRQKHQQEILQLKSVKLSDLHHTSPK